MDQSYCHALSRGKTCSFLDGRAASPGPPTLWEAGGHHPAGLKPCWKQLLTPGLKIVTTKDNLKFQAKFLVPFTLSCPEHDF